MILIGMLRKYKKPKIKDSVAAMFAKEHKADVIFFNPDQIDFERKVIYGQKHKNGMWTNDISYFPDVVYNDIPLKKDIPIYEKLEKKGIPFTTHRFTKNKMDFQRAIASNSFLCKYMIETIPYNGPEKLKEILNQQQSLFLKPNRGHKGLGIRVFEKVDSKIHINDATGINEVIPDNELETFLSKQGDLENYHIQPNIKSITKTGNPYVIRSYVGRDGKGNWRLFFHYAAVSSSKNKIVNVSIGSGISYITRFLEDMHGKEKAKTIKSKLNEVVIEMAKQTQTIEPKEIDALGIDLGMNKNGDIFIIEINTYPGTRPFEALVERHAVPYILLLAKNSKKNKENAD